MNKRDFIKSAAVIAGVSAITPFATVSGKDKAPSVATKQKTKVSLKKALVFGMIQDKVSLTDKFKIARDAGFDGIELDSPTDLPLADLLQAKQSAGIELPSVINKDHWSKPLSDPDQQIRQQCIDSVIKSMHEVKELGGDTVLVVPGVVNEKVSYEQAYITSQSAIRELIPHAEKTGVQIALENVWNNFILSPVEAKRFIDELNHPLVGWYFDIGNVLRYGWPEHWIHTLKSRIMRLHIKEFSRENMNSKGLREGFNVELLEGDNNWPVVMKAVREINYKGGWLTAEVPGGDRNHLKQISTQMDEIISYL
jgi:L-ribulose-5-phosphate 3-epimerase